MLLAFLTVAVAASRIPLKVLLRGRKAIYVLLGITFVFQRPAFGRADGILPPVDIPPNP